MHSSKKLHNTQNKPFRKFLVAAGIAAFAAFAIYNLSHEKEGSPKKQQEIATGKQKGKTSYFTKDQRKKELERKFAYDLVKFFTIKMPEMEVGVITHPLDAVSCIEDARIRAKELAGNGIVPDEDGDRHANGCPSLKELLKSIKDNPTPEALEALRRLILDYEDLFDPFFEVFDIGGGGAYASICAELTRNRSIKEGSYPLLTAIELAAINQDAFSIVSNYIIRYYFNGYSNELIDTLTTSIVNSSTTREEKMMMRANYMTRGLLNEVISPTFCDSVSDPKARIILGLTGTKQ